MSDFPVIITDEFYETDGQWFQYDAVPTSQRGALRTQKHTNIRSFVNDSRAAEVIMLYMDRLTMHDLDGKALSDFTVDAATPASVIVLANEQWSNGTVGPQSDRNNWNGISVTCDTSKSNLTITQSVILV